MKAGIATSFTVHALFLAGAMVSLASPPPFKTPEIEAITTELIPFEELTKSVIGDRKAELTPTPAPKQTTRPQQRPEAQNAGDTESDKPSDAEKLTKAPPVEKTEAPTPTPAVKPEPRPEKEPEPVAKPEPKPEPKPESVKKEEPEPKAEPEPEPKEKTDIALLVEKNNQPQETEEAKPEFQKLPDRVAAPKRRPSRPTTKTAEQTDAKKKAVVNKADANAGGAKASNKKASKGVKKSNNASKLAQSEIDALRGRLEGCWSVGDLTGHPDADKMRATVTFNLNRSGEIEGRVKVKVSGTDRGTRATLAVRVRAAVTECAPYNLPQEKYETWSEVVVNFSLADML